MGRWLRRIFWGFNPYYCACGHHQVFHEATSFKHCYGFGCTCAGFMPETTIKNLREVVRQYEHKHAPNA